MTPTEHAAYMKMREALEEAKVTIYALHGPIARDIYMRSAPEMKKIDAALSLPIPAEPTQTGEVTEEMVERVARAICGAYGDDFDEQPKDLDTLIAMRAAEKCEVHSYDPGLPTQEDWRECAVAALQAALGVKP